MSNPKVYPNISVHKMIRAFNGMELSSSEGEDLAHHCLKLELEFQKRGTDLEKVLSHGNKALNILISNQYCNMPCFGKHDGGNPNLSHGCSLFIASILNMLGRTCSKLKRYDESLSYLHWAERNLGKLEGDTSCCEGCLLLILHENQYELFMVKFYTWRREECPVHMKKILEIKERTMEEGCFELGVAYKDVADAYTLDYVFIEALPYQVKALEIYERHLAHDSVEIGQLRRHLSVMYAETGEYDKALEQNQLSQSVFKNTGNTLELLKAMVENGSVLNLLGRYEEAIDVIKAVVSHTDSVDTEVGLLATAFQYLATAYFYLGKFDVAKKHLKSSLKFLDKLDINCHDHEQQDVNRIYVSVGFGDIAKLYEEMKDFEPAISLSRRVLAVPNISQKTFLQSSDRLFSLIEQSCEGREEVSFLEDLLEKLKQKFGPEDLEVGYGYHKLGVIYLISGIRDLAAKNLACAKDVLDVCLGPTHLESLITSHILALTYASMGSLDLAIELQEKIIELLKGLGPSQQNFLDVAVGKLKLMKEDARGKVGAYPTRTSPRSEHAEDKSSKCDVSKYKKLPSSSSQAPVEGNSKAGRKQAKSKRRGR